MYECTEIGCPNKVSHPGQFCVMHDFDEEDDDEGFDPSNPEHLCIGCGDELRPDLMGYAGG